MLRDPTIAEKTANYRISPDWPVWYDPASPLGSAVRQIASLSPAVQWVGISRYKGKRLVKGPDLGERQDKGQIRSIRNREGKILGQIDFELGQDLVLSEDIENAITRIAEELGELWSV